MGRHGGGRSGGTRVSRPVVVIGLLVVAAIGFGFWLWSLRSVQDPVDANPVDAYAVVVSSPSCTADTTSTVIDLSLSTPVRSSLSACGRRVGERIAVQYLAGHPDQARLAGTAVAHNNSAGLWLPIAIVAAGLLAVIGTLSLLFERHRSRHDLRSVGSLPRLTVAELRAAAADSPPAAMMTMAAMTTVAPATPAGYEPAPAPSWPADAGSFLDRFDAPAGGNADASTRVAAGGVPEMDSTSLRVADIAVDDDLFTHRTHHPG